MKINFGTGSLTASRKGTKSWNWNAVLQTWQSGHLWHISLCINVIGGRGKSYQTGRHAPKLTRYDSKPTANGEQSTWDHNSAHLHTVCRGKVAVHSTHIFHEARKFPQASDPRRYKYLSECEERIVGKLSCGFQGYDTVEPCRGLCMLQRTPLLLSS